MEYVRVRLLQGCGFIRSGGNAPEYPGQKMQD